MTLGMTREGRPGAPGQLLRLHGVDDHVPDRWERRREGRRDDVRARCSRRSAGAPTAESWWCAMTGMPVSATTSVMARPSGRLSGIASAFSTTSSSRSKRCRRPYSSRGGARSARRCAARSCGGRTYGEKKSRRCEERVLDVGHAAVLDEPARTRSGDGRDVRMAVERRRDEAARRWRVGPARPRSGRRSDRALQDDLPLGGLERDAVRAGEARGDETDPSLVG